MSDSYNKELDKITEAEVVYDFVERLRLGRNLELPYEGKNKVVFKAKTLLLDILKFILSLLPPSIVFDPTNVTVDSIQIPVGTKTITCIFPGNVYVYRAYSDRGGMDIGTCFTSTYNSSTDKTTCTYTADVGYPYEDFVTIYAKKK